MTPRGTDWSLAALVALLAVTGGLTALAGSAGAGWVFAAHGAGGFALAAVLAFKARRVRGRLLHPRRWTGRARGGILAAALVVATLASGWLWSSGAVLRGLGYNLLNLHVVLGFALALGVLGHALLRARRPRRADVTDRRQFLTAAAVAGGALLAWQLQRPVQRALGWRGAERRFTGSYETAGAEGNAFPETSWVADRPRPIAARLPAGRHGRGRTAARARRRPSSTVATCCAPRWTARAASTPIARGRASRSARCWIRPAPAAATSA